MELTQSEVDSLIGLKKHPQLPDSLWQYPEPGDRLNIELTSADKRSYFHLDVSRSRRIDLHAGTYQNRYRKTIILARLDFGKSLVHRNPDGEVCRQPHIHIYRDGGARWAYPIAEGANEVRGLLLYLKSLTQPLHMLDDFMRFCNIEGVTVQGLVI